jgi:hypothetical protein
MDAQHTVTVEPGGLRLLAVRMDELESLFVELLAIVKDLVEVQTEFTDRKEAVR